MPLEVRACLSRGNPPTWKPARAPRVLTYPKINSTSQKQDKVHESDLPDVPSIYLINPTSLAKPHKIEHFRADIISYKPDVAVVVESWLKENHTDSSMAVAGYALFRRDRYGDRRGGGVAIYCRNQMLPSIFQLMTAYTQEMEVLWVRVKMSDHRV